jgi:RNA polymerase sigma-70 factor, ECF subfamily
VTIPARPFVFTSGVARARDDLLDRELLGGVAGGRPEALGELYDRHAASLFRHALALTRRRPDAEDLVQTVFMKLAATGAELLGVRQPASYLHRTLHTTWVDTRRRMITGERAVAQVMTESHWPPPADEASIDIARALDALPPVQREVIVLHLVEGFSFLEVGRLTRVSLFTAAGRYRLAINRLRKTLGPPTGEGDDFISELGATEVAVALRRFRLDRRAYPDDLSALVPGYLARLPIDPYTGKPPVYSHQGAGFDLRAQGSPSSFSRQRPTLDWAVPK